jgi:hypothetical protein
MSQARPQIAENLEHWARAHREALAAEAGELAAGFYLRPAQ